MPSKSKKQHNLMAAVANNPKFAKKVGVPQSVGEDYLKADKGRKFQEGGKIMKNAMKADMKAKAAAAKEAKMKAKAEKGAVKNQKKLEKDMMKSPVKKPVVNKPGGILGPKKPGVKKPEGKKPGVKKPGGFLGNLINKFGPKKPGKGDMMSKPVKQPVVKKPAKGGPKEQGTGKVFKTPESGEQIRNTPSGTPTQLKKGGMACKKYARGGGIEVRGKTKGKFI